MSWVWNVVRNVELRHRKRGTWWFVEPITVECTSFNTRGAFTYLIYLLGQLENLVCESQGVFWIVCVITHTNVHTFLASLVTSICHTKAKCCLYSLFFIYISEVLISIRLEAFELLSIQLNFSLPSFLKCLVIYLFPPALSRISEKRRFTISARCTLPSCCSALIKTLLEK